MCASGSHRLAVAERRDYRSQLPLGDPETLPRGRAGVGAIGHAQKMARGMGDHFCLVIAGCSGRRDGVYDGQ